jgi:hypothetical protein
MCKVIESAPKIVDDIPRSGESVERENWQSSEPLNLVSTVRIFLGADNCELLVPKGSKDLFEITEVLLGPFNFYADKNESIVCRQNI